MNQILTVAQKQNQTISPLAYQSLKILQMTANDLEDYIQDYALENPVLELDEPAINAGVPSLEALRENLSRSDEYSSAREYSVSADSESFPQARDYGEHTFVSLKEHLAAQFSAELTDDDFRLLNFVADFIDDNGYLTASNTEISQLGGFDGELVGYAVAYIQTLDPLGVGARSLGECLCAQLNLQGCKDPAIMRIVANHLEDVAAGHFSKIAKAVGKNTEWTREACAIIKTLSPKPASSFGGNPVPPLFADIRVSVNGGNPVAVIEHEAYSRPYINEYYIKLSMQDDFKEAAEYLDAKLSQARWLIDAIDNRRKTLTSIANLIAARQHEFFTDAGAALRPFTMKEAAQALEIHESTVSRAINGKYLACGRGTFPLKYFFTAAAVSQENGKGVSRNHAKDRVAQIIKEEDKASPLSDNSIAQILAGEGIGVSRRAVAKYRLELEIPCTSARRSVRMV